MCCKLDIVALQHNSVNDRPSIYTPLQCDDDVRPVDLMDCYLHDINTKPMARDKNCPARRLGCVCLRLNMCMPLTLSVSICIGVCVYMYAHVVPGYES